MRSTMFSSSGCIALALIDNKPADRGPAQHAV